MFNQLTYAERAKLFEGLSVLENKYGKDKVEKAIEIMTSELEEVQHLQQALDLEQKEETQKNKKRKDAVTKGMAKELALKLGYEGLNEMLVDLYYNKGLTQREIAHKFGGVSQGTLSCWIKEIPQITVKRGLAIANGD